MLIVYLSMFDGEREKNLFEKIYLSNRKLMLRIAEGIVPSGWAEDAVHNAFLRIARHIEKFSSLSCNERRCLCVTIVRNISLDMLRDSRPGKTVQMDETAEPSGETGIEDKLLRVERLADIERCIQTLDPVLRDVVNLRLILEYNTAETAALLGISQEAVRARLYRARAKLKELFIKEGVTHG